MLSQIIQDPTFGFIYMMSLKQDTPSGWHNLGVSKFGNLKKIPKLVEEKGMTNQ